MTGRNSSQHGYDRRSPAIGRTGQKQVMHTFIQQGIPMNRILFALLPAMLLLGGCGKPADAPVAGVPANAAGDQAVSAPEPVPVAADPAPAAANGALVTPAPDDHTAVNASIDRLLGDHAKYQAVILAYRKAIADGDKAAVAALVEYPIKVDLDGSKATIRDPATFIRDYDKIVTPAIARAIEAQKYSELMVNGQGVMFGNGETWINGVCKPGSADCSEFEVKVVTIQAGASN
jgi:hypothetical protein